MSPENELKFYYDKELIGKLNFEAQDDNFSFTYDEAWKTKGFKISPHIAFNTEAKSSSIKKFLQNLFPEGSAFNHLIEHFKISKGNVYAITRIIGKETTGGLTILEGSASPKETTSSFRKVEEKEIIDRLSSEDIDLTTWDEKPRLSVAGLQDKLPVLINEKGDYGFGEGDLASTHILKFQTGSSQSYHLVVNELFCMKLAEKIGLNVAETSFTRFKNYPALVVTRFDRERKDSRILRKHIIDGCQALDMLPDYKYERNFGSGRDVKDIREGVSLPKLFEFCKSCRVPGKAIIQTLHWCTYNLLISNNDNHGKNISYLVNSSGITPSPMYDMVNISLYPKLNQELAMAIGNEFNSLGLHDYQFAEMCEDCGIDRRLFVRELKLIAGKIVSKLPSLNEEIIGKFSLDNSEIKFLDELESNIEEKTKKFLKLSDDILTIKL